MTTEIKISEYPWTPSFSTTIAKDYFDSVPYIKKKKKTGSGNCALVMRKSIIKKEKSALLKQ